MHPALLLPIDSAEATLEVAGGKGASLAGLARAGFPVPPGFVVTTAAYRAFVAAHGLEAEIDAALAGLDAADPDALEAASARIRAAFAAAPMLPDFQQALRSAWSALGEPPVAVRSSATAEDLPDLSFAGQQDTFLNVEGGDALAQAVTACWSSLWTARAIGYRARNALDPQQIAIAVVVQEMVQSEAAGVLFTANPLTGLRSETVIDATLGLGEALVSGQVEPDHYVVETASGRIVARTLGAKAISIRAAAGGGVTRSAEHAARTQALPDAAIRDLAALGARVQAHAGGAPQDIEWAWAGGRLSLLQARPITSLYPLPETLPAGELAVMFSFGAVQGMQDPLTPLGQDLLRHVSSAFARLWRFDFAPGQVPAVHFAGQRMWLRFDTVLHSAPGRTLALTLLPMVEAGVGRGLEALIDDPRLAQKRAAPTPQTVRRFAGVLLPVLRRMIAALRDPEGARLRTWRDVDTAIAGLEAGAAATRTLTQRVDFAESAVRSVVPTALAVVPLLAAGMASFARIQALAGRAGIPESRVLEITLGLPHNVTTEMDLTLWEAARAIQRDAGARAALRAQPAAELARAALAGSLPPVAQAQVDAFLARYGMRGIGEIDFGRPRWREDPVQLLQMLQNYLQIDDPESAPDAVFRRGALSAERAIDALVEEVRARSGAAAAFLVGFFARRARALMGQRESPKFLVVSVMGVLRRMLLESFAEMAARGLIEDKQDGFFLTFDELRALDAGYAIDWKALVRERRALYDRELRRKQVPRLLLSDGRAFYSGAGESSRAADGSDVLAGSPVSPGIAEGAVRVVFDPHRAHLLPGEILVCPGTDPAWTPLFLSAGALVMEVGGLMTHGSVVAREYGIPAVVGVAQVTQRLRTGQRVRVDGTTGLITTLS